MSKEKMSQPKKILFVANVHWFYLHFLLPYIQWLTQMGHEVHVVAGSNEIVPFATRQYNIPIQRTPFSWKNVKAYLELKKIIHENNYDLIHCHTPLGGVIARLAARSFRKNIGLKVLYTAHGFYFYKGAPILYWLLYYPVEKYLSRYTDGLITINEEDFNNTRRFGFKCREIFQIPGIGVNTVKFRSVSSEVKSQIRMEKGYSENAFILIYAAEFIHRKNHRLIIDAIPQLIVQIPGLKVIFAGAGELNNELEFYTKKKGLLKIIDFVGYRNDMEKWMGMADVVISSCRMEGLPMNVAEAMFCGLPVVVTKIRGHVDLVTNGVNGLLFEEGDGEAFARHILDLYRSKELREKLGNKAKETVQPFGIENVKNYMNKYYKMVLS